MPDSPPQPRSPLPAAAASDSPQQQLEQLQREHALLLQQQATLLHCLSHDLRTPAMTILGFADLLLADGIHADPGTARQYLDHVRNSANRQITMISALIKLCSLQHRELQLTRVNLTDLLQQCAQQRAAHGLPANIVMEFAATPEVLGDRELLSEALDALLDNAIKFSAPRAATAIRFGMMAATAEQPASFFIEDNGVGINMERQSRLFKPFSRLHSGKEFPGLGVGLALAQLIIHKHGGRIWAESQPDCGATFRFTLDARP